MKKPQIFTIILLTALSACKSTPPDDNDYLQAKHHLDLAEQSIVQLGSFSSPREPARPKTELMNIALKESQNALLALERLAANNNAWGQYKLGLELTSPFAPPEQQRRACILLTESAKQGYLPAIYSLAGTCPNDTAQEQILILLERGLNNSEKFEMYYPARAMIYLQYQNNMTRAIIMPTLTKRAFEAEAYFRLGMATPAKTPQQHEKRLSYFKAAKSRDCEAAQTQIDYLLSIHKK